MSSIAEMFGGYTDRVIPQDSSVAVLLRMQDQISPIERVGIWAQAWSPNASPVETVRRMLALSARKRVLRNIANKEPVAEMDLMLVFGPELYRFSSREREALLGEPPSTMAPGEGAEDEGPVFRGHRNARRARQEDRAEVIASAPLDPWRPVPPTSPPLSPGEPDQQMLNALQRWMQTPVHEVVREFNAMERYANPLTSDLPEVEAMAIVWARTQIGHGRLTAERLPPAIQAWLLDDARVRTERIATTTAERDRALLVDQLTAMDPDARRYAKRACPPDLGVAAPIQDDYEEGAWADRRRGRATRAPTPRPPSPRPADRGPELAPRAEDPPLPDGPPPEDADDFGPPLEHPPSTPEPVPTVQASAPAPPRVTPLAAAPAASTVYVNGRPHVGAFITPDARRGVVIMDSARERTIPGQIHRTDGPAVLAESPSEDRYFRFNVETPMLLAAGLYADRAFREQLMPAWERSGRRPDARGIALDALRQLPPAAADAVLARLSASPELADRLFAEAALTVRPPQEPHA